MIEVKNLVKKYGSHVAVNDASFEIGDGEVVGFLGPNGAGKTTTMNILTGYLSATSGSVSIDGFDILEDPMEAKKRIGYLPEQPPLYMDMTVKEYLNFIYDLKKTTLPRKPHLAEICKLVKIGDVYNRLIRNLSKGYRQRVGIAQALVGNPDVLILDEPTVGLDPKQIIEIRNLIAQLGRNHTVILSSHILSEIQAVCERIIIINKGYLIADDSTDGLSRSLSEDENLLLKVIGPPKEVKAVLTQVPGVKSVRGQGLREIGSTEFFIEPQPGAEVRTAIFDAMVQKGWKIIQFNSTAMSLEEIFLQIVEEEPEEAAKMFQSNKHASSGESDEASEQTDAQAQPEVQEESTQEPSNEDGSGKEEQAE